MSLTIDQLNLEPNARRAAELVLYAHPGLIFTSGRRDVLRQAAAMAANTISYGVGWLGQTYKNREMVDALERWMEQNLEKTASVPQMTEGFYQTLVTELAGGLSMFPHCLGLAFDASCPKFSSGQIDEQHVNAILYTIKQLPLSVGLNYCTSREGKKRVLHADFKPMLSTVEI